MLSRKANLEDISATFRSAREGVENAIGLVRSVLSSPRFSVPRGKTKQLQMRRDLPYVIHTTSFLTHRILVNRNYKPLGYAGTKLSEWVKYEDWKTMHVSLSLEQIASVVSPGREHGLFGDGNAPWNSRQDAEAYLVRLERLVLFLPPAKRPRSAA